MSILDPSFREQLRAKRAKTQAQPDDDDAGARDVKGLADRDSLLRDVGADSAIQRFRRDDVADEAVGNIAWAIHCSEARVDGSNDRLDPDYRVPLPEMPLVPAAEPHDKPDTPLPLLPAQAYPLEEGLHRALPEMPPQVVSFLLHVPRDPPSWRHQESEGERAERQALENLGAWTG
jgi:hypothetical protein